MSSAWMPLASDVGRCDVLQNLALLHTAKPDVNIEYCHACLLAAALLSFSQQAKLTEHCGLRYPAHVHDATYSDPARAALDLGSLFSSVRCCRQPHGCVAWLSAAHAQCGYWSAGVTIVVS